MNMGPPSKQCSDTLPVWTGLRWSDFIQVKLSGTETELTNSFILPLPWIHRALHWLGGLPSAHRGKFVCYLHDQLMGTGHQGEAIGVVEGFRDVLSKGVASPSGRDAPPTTVVRVRPQQVTHGTLGGIISEHFNPEPKTKHTTLVCKSESDIVLIAFMKVDLSCHYGICRQSYI